MTRSTATLLKFTVFGLVMIVLTAFLFMVFGQTRTGSTNGYSAVFNDASRLKSGDSVRIAGIRVGTVEGRLAAGGPQGPRQVRHRPKHQADDRNPGRRSAISIWSATDTWNSSTARGSTKILATGSQIPVDRTAPALDLDLLLGGLKPVIQGLNPQDVNALTGSLIQILQGQGGTLESLFSKTSSFTNSLADNNQVIEQLIEDLRSRSTPCPRTATTSPAPSTNSRLVNGLSQDRDPIGTAITRSTTERHRSPICSAGRTRR